jgi:D-glycero-D-manno-heptose 1,7-bisphosphate phosphatase
MVRRAADKFGINLSKSWMVGDSSQDILMGREANIQTIFVGKKYPANLKIRPHYYAKDLAAAVKIILQ